MSGSRMAKILRPKLFADQNGLCFYCDRHLTLTGGGAAAATVDEVVPRMRGGRRSERNCVLACQDCNNAKGAMVPADLRRLADRIDRVMLERGIRPVDSG